MDRGAWWATLHRVTKSQTWLKQLNTHACIPIIYEDYKKLEQLKVQIFPRNSHCQTFLCCCSVTKSCLILCDPMDYSTQGFPVLHHLPEFAQTHVHRVGDVIQPSHSLFLPFPPALNLSQHQGLSQWAFTSGGQSMELQFQHQSFLWIFRVDFL